MDFDHSHPVEQSSEFDEWTGSYCFDTVMATDSDWPAQDRARPSSQGYFDQCNSRIHTFDAEIQNLVAKLDFQGIAVNHTKPSRPLQPRPYSFALGMSYCQSLEVKNLDAKRGDCDHGHWR